MFFEIRLVDIFDIFLMAFLLFQGYKMIKGTVTFTIFIGLFSFLGVWLLVKALNMKLLGAVFDNLISVGVIAIIVLFQEEIRKFLIVIGSRYNFNHLFNLENIIEKNKGGMLKIYIKTVVQACSNLSKSKTGALIIITKQSDLPDIVKTGETINATINSSLIESVFFKNNPLHDGAMIISGNKVKAVRCILPISHNTDLPKSLGLRHRAGLGMAQGSDAQVIIVSEETGKISFAQGGKLVIDITPEKLFELLKIA